MAIGRLHVEREDIKKVAMIEGAAVGSGDEKDTDTFLTGTNVEDKKNFDNVENSQALVEQNIGNSNATGGKRSAAGSMQ